MATSRASLVKMKRWVLAIGLLGCKGGDEPRTAPVPTGSARPAAPDIQGINVRALRGVGAIHDVYRAAQDAAQDRTTWPTAAVPGLDFARPSGNALVIHRDSRTGVDPVSGIPGFQLFAINDDPFLLAQYVHGVGVDKGMYRSANYLPQLELIGHATYVVLVFGDVTYPQLIGKEFTGGHFDGAAVIFELESKRLLGGVELAASNSDAVDPGATGRDGMAAVMKDFQGNTRKALAMALQTRFPDAKLPPYLTY